MPDGATLTTPVVICVQETSIVAIPRAIEEKVLTLAFDKIAKENETEAALRRGEKLADVFARFEVL